MRRTSYYHIILIDVINYEVNVVWQLLIIHGGRHSADYEALLYIRRGNYGTNYLLGVRQGRGGQTRDNVVFFFPMCTYKDL